MMNILASTEKFACEEDGLRINSKLTRAARQKDNYEVLKLVL